MALAKISLHCILKSFASTSIQIKLILAGDRCNLTNKLEYETVCQEKKINAFKNLKEILKLKGKNRQLYQN